MTAARSGLWRFLTTHESQVEFGIPLPIPLFSELSRRTIRLISIHIEQNNVKYRCEPIFSRYTLRAIDWTSRSARISRLKLTMCCEHDEM